MSGFAPRKHEVAANFSRAAWRYESLARHQAIAARNLVARLPADLRPRHVLDLGCGTGLLIRLLAGRFPDADFTAVDLSEAMLDVCRSRSLRPSDQAVRADAEHWWPERPVDLCASSCSVQWFQDRRAGSAPRGNASPAKDARPGVSRRRAAARVHGLRSRRDPPADHATARVLAAALPERALAEPGNRHRNPDPVPSFRNGRAPRPARDRSHLRRPRSGRPAPLRAAPAGCGLRSPFRASGECLTYELLYVIARAEPACTVLRILRTTPPRAGDLYEDRIFVITRRPVPDHRPRHVKARTPNRS